MYFAFFLESHGTSRGNDRQSAKKQPRSFHPQSAGAGINRREYTRIYVNQPDLEVHKGFGNGIVCLADVFR